MQSVKGIILGMVGLCVVAGCRTATRVVQEPRVDLELGSGNRGYLLGTPPPAAGPRQTTREMIETEVEVPSFSRPKRAATTPVGLEEVAPPEMDMGEEGLEDLEEVEQAYDTYVVKKGDTLWSIAADPAIFGDATKWRQLFAANRDVLKSPDRLRAGMTLRIPRGGLAGQEATSQTTSFRK